MDTICSRWRKPKGRPSRKRQNAVMRAKNRWEKMKTPSDLNTELSNVTNVCVIESNIAASENISEPETPKSIKTVNTPDAEENNKMKENISPNHESRTVKKLRYFDSECPAMNQSPAYTIIHDSMWSELLKNLTCEKCGMKQLNVNNSASFGYSAKLNLSCSSCKTSYGTSFSSPRMTERRRFEVNKSMVEAFLNIGKGHSAMENFSMTLGLHALDRKTFDKCVLQIFEESKHIRETVLDMARKKVREVYEAYDPDNMTRDTLDIGVSFDCSWHKRGHTSLYGIGCVIDIMTGLIVDYHILSKYCHDCAKTASDLEENSTEYAIWFEEHKKSSLCDKNYEGTSGAMEVCIAEILWKRSIENCHMRYINLLSDGDSKAFLSLSKLKVYKDISIVKEECLNHVSKRLGTSLRNKVKEWRAKGVCLGGKKKGNLTDETITKLTNYYRKAIKDNIPDVNKMKSAIFASLHHSMSTDTKPQHNKCPSGSQSWCFYNRALASNKKMPSHEQMKTKLSQDVVSKILPVYQRLASDEILNRCTSGKTQNSNESFHSVLWRYCPKDTFISKKRLELAAISAISKFNMGVVESLNAKIPDDLRSPTIQIAKRCDKRRLQQSVYRSNINYKKKLQTKKFNKSKKERKTAKKEGASYSAGAF